MISVNVYSYLLISLSILSLYAQDTLLIGSTQCCKIALSPLSLFFFAAGSTCFVNSVSTVGSSGEGCGNGLFFYLVSSV